jgi:small subunit ribosomal protein S3
MGHKTHPIGFRLGITAQDKSIWHTKLTNYAQYINEDYKLRSTLLNYLDFIGIQNAKGIVAIYIHRSDKHETIRLKIQTARPGIIVGKEGANLSELDKRLTKQTKLNKVRMEIMHVTNPYEHADLLAEILVEQLETRVPFRRAMKNIAERIRDTNIKGIKIQVGGRLNGAEIARTEWLREGRVPLQTIRADIDYSYKTAKTIYGILGIKIWLFKGEFI